MSDALLLTASDLRPLREHPGHIGGASEAVAEAVASQFVAKMRHQHLEDIASGEPDGLRLSVTAVDGMRSGMRVFGNPPHTRAYMLFERDTRALIATMDYGVLNSLRVGATAGVTARYLAPPKARILGLIGSGWQAQPQLDGLRHALPSLELVRVFSPTRANREAFARSMSVRLGLRVEAVESTRQALVDADIVDLCAPGHSGLREPLFQASWIKPGALVIAMAPNQCPADFVQGASVVAVSWEALTQPEIWPPFDRLIKEGTLTKAGVTSLGAVISGHSRSRTSNQGQVLYHLEGGSASDLFIASWAYDWAKAQGVGRHFDLSA